MSQAHEHWISFYRWYLGIAVTVLMGIAGKAYSDFQDMKNIVVEVSVNDKHQDKAIDNIQDALKLAKITATLPKEISYESIQPCRP